MTQVLDAKPRVIAAEIKSPIKSNNTTPRKTIPRIAGELDLVGETTSEPHYVEIRDGALYLYPGRTPDGNPLWRLPLRKLNLQPASSGRPRGFSLTRNGETVPLATFQVGNDVEYERWVKTLAVELMRQTPLDAVRFLDILGITASLTSPSTSPTILRRTYSADNVHLESSPRVYSTPSGYSSIQEEESSGLVPRCTQSLQRHRKNFNVTFQRKLLVDGFNNSRSIHIDANNKKDYNFKSPVFDCTDSSVGLPSTRNKSNISCSNNDKKSVKHFKSIPKSPNNKNLENPPLPDVIRDLPPCERRSRARIRVDKGLKIRGLSADPSLTSLTDDTVAKLMARCQQDDKYVPVKDKKLLFETLCYRHFVCSTDNINSLSMPLDLCSYNTQPRAQSLHDLRNSFSVPVKDMCKYFEQREQRMFNSIQKKRTLSDCHQSLRRIAPPRNRLAATQRDETFWRLHQQSFHTRRGELIK